MSKEVVYISSTQKDLSLHRLAAVDTLRRSGLDTNNMELYTARDVKPLDMCLQHVRECDLYVLLMGYRYGSRPRGEERSFTELEFEEALKHNKNKLVFLADYDYCSMQLTDQFNPKSDRGRSIEAFRDRIAELDILYDRFKSPEDLKIALSEALHQRHLGGIRPDPATRNFNVLEAQIMQTIQQDGSALEKLQSLVSRLSNKPVDTPDPSGRAADAEGPADVPLNVGLKSGSSVTLEWYSRGLNVARSVACLLEKDHLPRATAFAIDPVDFGLPQQTGRITMMTANHCLSAEASRFSLTPEDVSVRFETHGPATYPVDQILFEDRSTRGGLDTTIFTVQIPDLDIAHIYPNFDYLPRLQDGPRVYVVGHSMGKGLQFAISDNWLIDHEGPHGGTPEIPGRVRVHYFAPTAPGSSGSPVFNENWECIAIHHAAGQFSGGGGLARLNGKPGRYSANEGIWMGSIRETIRKG